MTFILVPKSGEDLQINAWNWRPTLELLREAKLITEEQYEGMGAQGAGGVVDAESAKAIANFVEGKLAEMKSEDRMRADLTVTSEPKALRVFTPNGSNSGEADLNDTYSATYERLVTFADFCRRSGGFEVF
jgi:hypothetical protein